MNQKKVETQHTLSTAAGQIFLTETDLAHRWQISVKTLQADRLKGAGARYCKFGRSVRYRLADIFALEERQVRRSTSDKGRPM